MSIPFAKLHGAGNGYIVVDGRQRDDDWPGLAQVMTRSHMGVGSDGLIVVQDSESAQIRMRVFNSDGSEAEMSGNGIRILAKYVLDRDLVRSTPDGLQVETGGGCRTVWPTLVDGKLTSARVAMGSPTFIAAEIPVHAPAILPYAEVRNYPLDIAGHRLYITCLAIGNPHAVAFIEEPVDSFPLRDIGPEVERHPMFPNRVNFEIVNLQDRDNIRARVFERGEGETLSSGTCSTAAAIAARLYGHTGDEIWVHLPGGDLKITWSGSGEAYLEGPVEEVFTGTWTAS